MSQSSPRFAPLQILDSDWRARVWKGWLRSRWLGIEDARPPAPEGQVAKTLVPPPAVPTNVTEAAALSSHTRSVEGRRHETRMRFDALVDRLGRLEDNLESLMKRVALDSIHRKRHEHRILERVETSGELLERLTLGLEAMQATIGRVEQRLGRLERGSPDDGVLFDESSGPPCLEVDRTRPSPAKDDYEDFGDLDHSFGYEPTTGTRAIPTELPDPREQASFSGPSIHGDLSEMSLGTLLAMLELERRTGLLKVSAEDGYTVTATLRDGAIVGARRREVEVEPVEAVRDALRFQNGHFWFQQSRVEVASGPPRSVGSVLLEASSRNDEASRADGRP